MAMAITVEFPHPATAFRRNGRRFTNELGTRQVQSQCFFCVCVCVWPGWFVGGIQFPHVLTGSLK